MFPAHVMNEPYHSCDSWVLGIWKNVMQQPNREPCVCVCVSVCVSVLKHPFRLASMETASRQLVRGFSHFDTSSHQSLDSRGTFPILSRDPSFQETNKKHRGTSRFLNKNDGRKEWTRNQALD